MAFDEVEFPLKAGFGASAATAFSTEIVVIDGGYERRNQAWSQARKKFDAKTGVRSNSDAMELAAFFQARRGRARGFRLKDWSDFSSAADGVSSPLWSDQVIGVGDGVTTSFQLLKNYGGSGEVYQRLIRKPKDGSVTIGVAGAQVAEGWSVDATTGIVTFVSPPDGGASVVAGYRFDVPVRFDTDQLSIVNKDGNLFCADVPLIEIRV